MTRVASRGIAPARGPLKEEGNEGGPCQAGYEGLQWTRVARAVCGCGPFRRSAPGRQVLALDHCHL